MSSLTSAGTAVRLARIRNNDIFNTLVANPRWSLSSDPNSIKSDSEFIKPSVPFMPQYGKPTKGRYGRFKVLAHLVSALTVNHDDNKWQILADLFADGLTGIDRIVLVGTANKFRLGLWIAVFATLVITTLYFITLTVIEYWQYNTIVSVTLVGRNPDILPAITICNLNPFRKDVLCDPDGAFYSVRQSICEESKNSEQFAYHMTRFRTHSATNKTLAAFIEKSKYTWEDIVISCSFNQEDCKSDWVQEETVSFYRYGRCFCMFCNLTAVNENVRFFLSSGRLHGLNLVLNSSMNTYLTSRKSVGFLIMIHDRNRLADANMDGIYAPLAMSTFIGISKKQVNLLEAPFRSNCHTTWPKGKPYNAYLSEHDRYSEESCRKVCISYNIMRLCNCLEMYKGTDIQKLLDANSVCVDYKEGTACRDKFVQNPGGITDACDCPKRCEEVTYKRSVSRVAWTQTLRSGGIDQEQATPLSNIVIYLQSAMVTAITEKEEMSAISALSNVGGFLNMFTGTSFLMIYEAFGIFVMWFYKVFSGYRRKERKLPFIESLNLKY